MSEIEKKTEKRGKWGVPTLRMLMVINLRFRLFFPTIYFLPPNNFSSDDKSAGSSQIQMFVVSTNSGSFQLLHFTLDRKR